LSERPQSGSPGARVLGIGELLWDLLPSGPRLGGAPFNVIANLRRLGHEVRFATLVGDDDRGRDALAAATGLGVDTQLIGVSSDAPTGTVTVELDARGGPTFRIQSPAAYERLALDAGLLAGIAAWRPDALIFGTLAQRFAGVNEATRQVIDVTQIPVRLYDVNLRDGCWSDQLIADLLPLATVVKANDAEAPVIARLLGVGADGFALAKELSRRFGCRALCVTRGASGATLWLDGRVFEVGGRPISAVDTVGAGDAFAAGLLDGILRGASGEESLDRANRLGAIVASRAGALPEWDVTELEG
jgi:fructokinase